MISDLPYIFVIGFNKSGTTSIHEFFLKNGFPSIHWDSGRLAKNAILNVLHGRPVFYEYDQKYRVFSDLAYRTDIFWFEGNSLFKEIDKDYPNSFFIYNKRDLNSWLRSRLTHNNIIAGMSLIDLHKKIFRVNDINLILANWKRSRLRFEEDIREYFLGNEKFIELDIEDADFVKKLSLLINFKFDSNHWQKQNVNPQK